MQEILKKRKFISASIDKVEGKIAALTTDDGQLLNWPVAKLPSGAGEGLRVKLVIFSDKSEEEEREAMAKTLLNEILKTE